MDALPLHLLGNNAPVDCEVTLLRDQLEVVGDLPSDLHGAFLRNGPNPRTGSSAHLFDGDGMIHGVALAGGEACWYRNRYVRTPLFEKPGTGRAELAFDPRSGGIDYRVSTANTHVVEHAGRILALEEGGFPYEVTLGLDTVGPFTFDGLLRTPMTAHPKRCPVTGDLLFFGYQLLPPFVAIYRATPRGTLAWTTTIEVPRATLMHDFAITATRLVVMDSPLVFDPRGLSKAASPWIWDEAHGARFGVIDRDGEGAAVRWFDVATCHLSHVANAYDDSDSVVITGTRIVDAGLPRMHEWRIDLSTGRIAERPIDDADSDYPRIADDRVGLENRFSYTASFHYEAEPHHTELYKYDSTTGNRGTFRLPEGSTCGEPVFVRRGADGEDDGFLMTFVHDRTRGASSLMILDARDVPGGAIAEVRLPVRVPGGFHGSWIAATPPQDH